MRSSIFSALALDFCALSHATYNFPAEEIASPAGGIYHGIEISPAGGEYSTHTLISTATNYVTSTSTTTDEYTPTTSSESIHTLTYVQTSHAVPRVFYNTSTSLSIPSLSLIYTTPTPGTAPPVANGTFAPPTATTGTAQPGFTGAAAQLVPGVCRSIISGGLIAMIGTMFL